MKQHPTAVLTTESQENTVLLDPDLLLISDELSARVSERESGNLRKKGLFLSSTLNWQIVTDSEGHSVLVATKK